MGVLAFLSPVGSWNALRPAQPIWQSGLDAVPPLWLVRRTMLSLDLVVLADPRLPGADGRCLAALLDAAAGAGYRVGLLAQRGPAPAPSARVAPALQNLLAAGRAS